MESKKKCIDCANFLCPSGSGPCRICDINHSEFKPKGETRYDLIGQAIAKTHKLHYCGVQSFKGLTLLLFTPLKESGLPPTTIATNETSSNILEKLAGVKRDFHVVP